jgi:hypothetical protein
MKRADDEDAGVVGVHGVPHMKHGGNDDAGGAGVEEWRK